MNTKFNKIVVAIALLIVVTMSACTPPSIKGNTMDASPILSSETNGANMFEYLQCVHRTNTFDAWTSCLK